MSVWDPERYRLFESERFAPFDDLLALVTVRDGIRAVDLGCGTGELTERLADRLPGSDVVGIDTSEEMLARARARARDGLRFRVGAIEDERGRYDLIFSNAALHWCEDHRSLLRRLYGMLEPSGQLVAQFPAQRRPDSYAAIVDVAGEEPFASALGGWTQPWPVLSLEHYATLFWELGASGAVTLEKVYPHVLAGADAVLKWQSGSVLLAYRERLDAATFERFTQALLRRLRERFGAGPVFFGFRRAFVAATRPS